MEYKVAPVNVKALDDGNGAFQGYASTWDNWDSVMERPARGAFKNSLAAFVDHGFIALGHSWDSLPIATVKNALEDDHGLLIEAEFHGTTAAQDARRVLTERLSRGKSAKLSIGYEVLRDTYVNDPPGGRILEEVKLYEVSLVNVPANDRASIVAAKSGPRAGLPMAEHSDLVRAAIEEYTERLKGLHDLRAKEGRVLSDANRKRITSLKDALAAVLSDLDELLVATEPRANTEKARALFAEFQRIQAQLNGVSTT